MGLRAVCAWKLPSHLKLSRCPVSQHFLPAAIRQSLFFSHCFSFVSSCCALSLSQCRPCRFTFPLCRWIPPTPADLGCQDLVAAEAVP